MANICWHICVLFSLLGFVSWKEQLVDAGIGWMGSSGDNEGYPTGIWHVGAMAVGSWMDEGTLVSFVS